MTATVTRKIHFYRLSVEPDGDGDVPAFSPAAACAAIGRLQFQPNSTGSRSRYMDVGGGEAVCVWPRITSQKCRLCIGTIRRDSLPHLEHKGEVTPLEIEQEKGLVEQTHVSFFDDGIVGAEFNFYGPRLSKLALYLREKCPAFPDVKFAALLNNDARKKLSELQAIRMLKLRLRRSDIDLLRQASHGVMEAMAAASDQVDAPVIEITLQTQRHTRESLSTKAMDFLKRLVGIPQLLESAEVFCARGLNTRTGKIEAVDFLADRLVFAEKAVKLERHRAVNSTDMFAAIERHYNENREELRLAAGLEE